MDYNFQDIEKKWQANWKAKKNYQVEIDASKPKYYVLDMFPYPSGAGLHVGHPLGYIASDIFSRFKRLKGFNVLHPMGFDAYGLPAEQYAIETGQHPAITTETNIKRYKEQLDKIGFSYDWDREVQTCDPAYYQWTQWAFIKMFNAWYNKNTNKAENIDTLIAAFEIEGNINVNAASSETETFTGSDWKAFSTNQQQEILLNYRLAYLANTMVNWCPGLGTVLANDEVVNGRSERGGFPVERKAMKQWSLRISAYSQRLLDGLDNIDWTDSLKEMQRNWIGRSEGSSVFFKLEKGNEALEVFTTRPDTLFGATFIVIAPEHELINSIITPDRMDAVQKYIVEAKNRTERDRIAEVKRVTGEFTGAYAIHPLTGNQIPIWVADYVLAGYGTGAIMAVPAHDSRDYAFAKLFNIPIIQVVAGGDISEESYDAKDGEMMNSEYLNGLDVKVAIKTMIKKVEEMGIGKGKVNFRLRDAIFSRQRYWGEPFPIYFKDGLPYPLEDKDLPLQLPEIDAYLPTETGEPPLGRAKNWKTKDGYPLELSTMPGFAGSSAYYLRYMDPKNDKCLVSKEANEYWRSVDLYIGGTEHATGHLVYARYWNKFLFDLGYVCEDEPFKKLINQGMIQGRSNFVYRNTEKPNQFISYNLRKNYQTVPVHVDINIVKLDVLDTEAFKNWRADYENAEFVLEENGQYICGWEVEKMSKSKYNVQNPDDLVEKYGADTLRLYEMFLGPLELSKPWDTNGIEGVSRFMRKLWKLYHDKDNNFEVSDEEPTKQELKVLHRTIKKVQDDIERFSFNTCVSNFMICVNELNELKCNKRAILSELTILISPSAPHIAEELWSLLGNKISIINAAFPTLNESYLVEDLISYPVSFNGKMRFKLEIPSATTPADVEKLVLASEESTRWLEGKTPKKVIIVPGKIVNVVV